VKFLQRFVLADAWGAFKFSVLLIWVPIFLIGVLSAEWPVTMILGWLILAPIVWILGITVRATWFLKFYRTSSSFEEDYSKFTKRV
jgi:hypothetical protein